MKFLVAPRCHRWCSGPIPINHCQMQCMMACCRFLFSFVYEQLSHHKMLYFFSKANNFGEYSPPAVGRNAAH